MAEREPEDGFHSTADSPSPISPRKRRFFGLFDRDHRRNVFLLISILASLILGLLAATIYLGVEVGERNQNGLSLSTNSLVSGQDPPENSPLENTAVAIIPALNISDRQLVYQGKDMKLKFRTWSAATDAWSSDSYNLSSNLSPRNGTPLAELTSANMSERKIFFVNDQNILSDAFFDRNEGTWKLGSLAASKNFQPAAESKLTAIMWNNGGTDTQWIYWQDSQGFLQETGYISDEWKPGDARKFQTDKIKATFGSGITTAIRKMGGDEVLTIFAQLDKRIISWGFHKGEWNSSYETVLESDKLPDVIEALTATTTETDITLYFSGKRFVSSVGWNNVTGWENGIKKYAEGGAGLAAKKFGGKERVYFVKNDDEIGEFVVDGGQWNVTEFEEV
ncbi:hypothetical protein K440DRAFT_662027 [Wilcoxina mikolae CBS 423.85]|nr:hypothetical protein K440DRAFT_662027 [Wilcoxina mikolae CBS 423.85]